MSIEEAKWPDAPSVSGLMRPLLLQFRPYSIESSSVRVRPKQHQLELQQEVSTAPASRQLRRTSTNLASLRRAV